MNSIVIKDKIIGGDHPPFIIAEMSGNHNQSLQKALEIVEKAASAGVHALKLQTYTADTMTLDLSQGDFSLDENNQWNHSSLYKLYEQAHTPWEWHQPIFDRCAELGILGFSSPFDETAVDFLESLSVPCYKIASFENTDLPLIRKAAKTGKPLIISTGMATVAEIDEAVRTARESGCSDLILLKCTSTYPATPEYSNVRTIPHLKTLFKCHTGLSDHTLGLGAAVASVALGAVVIEKHLTLSRKEGGVDSAFSMEPEELQALVDESKRAWEALGEVSYGQTASESSSRQYRRTLYVVQDVKAGEVFTKKNIRAIRPGYGLPSKYMDIILGKKAAADIKKGTPVSWKLI
ncbi:pseudaminic acid synthase [Halobacillus sp. A1]|uniref:pseudaminic acid synthase n=1 Tax=Halobacillus sp. A1 TaxID=2880262 RepID=UPI0020A6D677|nr:pseudaminic acid synthase [Halobacillus sp. A1]MCP3029963.1 pseudaminic acid synthase [Halobacillus sp. A1]